MSSDMEGIVGVRHWVYSGRSVLAENSRRWRAARGSVKGTGIKDKEKVSTSQSERYSAFGREPGEQKEAHPIR